jgi:hypothetical protein
MASLDAESMVTQQTQRTSERDKVLAMDDGLYHSNHSGIFKVAYQRGCLLTAVCGG